MPRLVWDQTGSKFYETGTDRAVLYVQKSDGTYDNGVAWSGITGVSENPSGADANPIYADNIKYLELRSAEEFGCTIEAYTYPDAFAVCDGSAFASAGVKLGQQRRNPFGFTYRTRIGNDTQFDDHGYKIHLVYNAVASPSGKSYQTVNDSPEAITFSWEVTTTKVPVSPVGTGENKKEYRPVATIEIDSTKVDEAKLKTLEDKLYGSAETEPTLPTPDQVIAMFAA